MSKKIFTGCLIALCLCVNATAAQEGKKSATKKEAQDHVQINGRSLRWEHRSGDDETDVTLAAKDVEFNDDYTDIERIAADGYFRLSEKREGRTRRVEITPGADGQLKRAYWEQGVARPFDDAARKWLGKLLAESVAGSGYDVEGRVERLLRRGGVNAVLSETGRLKSDYARRVYASVLVERGNLNSGQLAKLLAQSSSISSDYEKATLLIHVLKNNLADTAVRSAFFETANTLSSDYERGRVLSVLLKRSDLSPETLLLALKSVGGMSSDFEKANVLIRAAGQNAADKSVRAAIVEAAQALSSDYERGRVLTAVNKKGVL
ncbi:MAG TPA: hypothetical protein VF656_10675 [Pyrinomonadaceae bacterium]|jgi:hypothetical protein